MKKIYLLACFVFILFLMSCSRGSIYGEVIENLSILFSDPEDVQEELVREIPYSTMQARIGRSKNSLIVLEEVRGDILKWTTSNFVKIYTTNDHVVKLTGLGNELENLEFDKNHPAVTKNFENAINKKLTSFYTFQNPSLFRLPVKTEITYIRDEEIEIFGNMTSTKLYKEQTLENLISWNFENYFWVNDQREIIKSIQNFSPKNPAIYLLTTNKYKKPD